MEENFSCTFLNIILAVERRIILEERRVKPVEKVETFGIFRGIVERFAEAASTREHSSSPVVVSEATE